MAVVSSSLPRRFEAKVDRSPGLGPDGDCHEWRGSRNAGGYGMIWSGAVRTNGSNVIVLAHRATWFLTTGEWPDLFVLHHCDNPRCVRIEHLFLGTTTRHAQQA